METMDWIEFGVRTAIALGTDITRLVQAMREGDVSTVDALKDRLDPADHILARGEALKADVRRTAAP